MLRLFLLAILFSLNTTVFADTIVGGYNRSKVDILEFKGVATPSLSPSGKGKIYYKSSDNKFYCSVNGGAYAECINVAAGGSGTVTSVATSNGITGGTITSTGTVSGVNAAADGSTKGVSAYTATDFDASSGLISIDYTNSQAATGSVKGFLTAADWTTFNAKGTGTVGTGTARAFAIYPASTAEVDDSPIAFTDGTNIGIGNTAPTARLQVDDTGSGTSAQAFNVGTNAFVVKNSGLIGVGTSSPVNALDIIGANNLQLRLRSVSTNSTNKNAYIGLGHYTNTEEDVGILIGTVTTSLSTLRFGGGSSGYNAAMELQFYTAADTVTTTGTQRMTIKSDGKVGLGTTAPATTLDLQGSATITGTIRSTRTTDIGWGVVVGANTACNTTCTNACAVGFDQGTLGAVLGSIVGCADATADQCLCAGSL